MILPKISIIVPVYNSEKYLKRCLDSLTEQTLEDIEIILVDDASTDNSPQICAAATEKDRRIKVIRKANGGPGMARNAGLAAAKGKYIGFADSDDYVSPDMFEKLYNAAEKYSAQLVISGVTYVGGNMFGSGDEYSDEYFDRETLLCSAEDMQELILGIVGALPHEKRDSRYGTGVWKNLYRRDVIETGGIKFMSEREIMSEDAIFLIDYAACITKAAGIPGAFYRYCRNGESLSKSYDPERLKKCMTFLDTVEEKIGRNVPRSTYKIYMDRLTQAYGRVICAQEIIYAMDNKTGYRALRKRLGEVCTEARIKDSLKKYPWYKLPLKQAAFAFMMKYRLYFLQILAVRFRGR